MASWSCSSGWSLQWWALLKFFLFGIGGIFGLLGVLWGALMIVSAFMFRANPQQHVGWGIAIIIFSCLSWVGAFGGAFIGFLLGLVGGILAMVWQPIETMRSQHSVPISQVTPGALQPQTTFSRSMFCPNCGKPVAQDARFCPNCGKTL
ncbi:MAG: DUF6114 domain-containing protein [Thaumarchaeota archaeon]|nr:DUF6114 domain-containing protein [Nitrososphaerota archaeon]